MVGYRIERFPHHCIAEADVNLQRDASLINSCDKVNADALVLCVFLYQLSLDRCDVELNAVFAWQAGNIGDSPGHALSAGFAEAEQVEIFRWPVRTPTPDDKEHSALQEEVVPMSTLTKTE